jgi:nucleoid-associated protein YgaU
LDDDAEAAAAPAETPSEDRGADTVKIRITPEPEEEGFELSEDAEAAWNEPDPEPVIRPIPRLSETETTARVGSEGGTYVVKKGDNGFWIIAQRVYGQDKGKYWTLIRDANPTADTNALREGQMLKIPPLPAGAAQSERASAATARESFGRVSPGTGGNQVYVVAEGEAGLWGVAEKVYNGKGYLWEHIQRANPGVKPTALKAGMKLIIPPLPTTATRPGRATTRTATGSTGRSTRRPGEIFTENGRRYYIVQAGDKGYWGIAKKVYKDGKYSYLIDRANTGVDSYSLQPGDKLEVPPIPATTGRRTPPAPRRRTVPRAGEPDFGP